MAIGRINVRVGKKGKALPHLQYIQAEDKYANKIDEIVHIDHLNMPAWASDNPAVFWETADKLERKNGSVYREHILSLPRELSDAQNLDLTRQWIAQEFGERHALSYAFHKTKAKDEGMQPHIHLMVCDRELDGIERSQEQFFKRYNPKNPEKGGAKKLNTGMKSGERKKLLYAQRSRWGDLVNEHLLKNGIGEQVDMRNWVQRGEQKKPSNYAMGIIKRDLLPPEHPVYDRPLREVMPFHVLTERNRLSSKISYFEMSERMKTGTLKSAFEGYSNVNGKFGEVNNFSKMGEVEKIVYANLRDESNQLSFKSDPFKDYNRMTVRRYFSKYGLDLDTHEKELKNLSERNPHKNLSNLTQQDKSQNVPVIKPLANNSDDLGTPHTRHRTNFKP